jgi:hypothetical protein
MVQRSFTIELLRIFEDSNITRHHEGQTRVNYIQCIAITIAHLR